MTESKLFRASATRLPWIRPCGFLLFAFGVFGLFLFFTASPSLLAQANVAVVLANTALLLLGAMSVLIGAALQKLEDRVREIETARRSDR